MFSIKTRPDTLQKRRWNVIIFFVLCLNPLLSKSSPTASLGGDQAFPRTQLNPQKIFFPKHALKGQRPSIEALDHDDLALNLTDALPGIQPLQPNKSEHYFRRSIVDPYVVYNNSLKTAAPRSVTEANKSLYKINADLRTIYLAMALIPAFIMCYGAFSSFVRSKLHLGEAMLAITFGILLGPHVAGVFDPRSWAGGASFNEVTLEITRIIVALDVFSVGVELPAAYIRHHWRTMICLLGPVLLASWFITGAFILIFVPALSYLEALVIAACICPTDVLLASSVVGKGRYAKDHVPPHLQHLLQAEAGANDGAAIILVYLALFLVLRNDYTVAHAIGSWILLTVLYHIMVGIVMGVVAGILARKILKFAGERSLIDNESMVPMYISLSLLTAGVCILAGTDDIVAAFACGTAFGWDGWFSHEIEASNYSGIISNLINTFVFIYVGATIPFKAWNDAILTLVGWKMALLVISIFLLRRLPVILFLRKLIPELRTTKEALFCAHFGPVGVSGLFISFLATKKLPVPSIPAQSGLDILSLTIQPILYLLVFCSVFIHGLSIPFFTVSKTIRSRANSMRRNASLSSGNRPSMSRHRRSTSNQRPSLSMRETSIPNNLPNVGAYSGDSTPANQSDTLQLDLRYLSPSGPSFPLLSPLGTVPSFQPVLKCQDAGYEVGTNDNTPRELNSAASGKLPDRRLDEPGRTHVTSCPVIMCDDETEMWPLPSTSSPNHYPSPGNSPRPNRLTTSSSSNSVRSLSFCSDSIESADEPTKRRSTCREAEIQSGEDDGMYFALGCNQNVAESDSHVRTSSTVTDAWQSDERLEGQEDASPNASLTHATRLHAHSIVLRPRRFSGRAPRQSRRISRVPKCDPMQESINTQPGSGSALSCSSSTRCEYNTPDSNGATGRCNANKHENNARGQNPTDDIDPLQRRFNFTRNINAEQHVTEETKGCPSIRSSSPASPRSRQHITTQLESNQMCQPPSASEHKPFYSRMLSLRSADHLTGCDDRYTAGTQSVRRDSRAYEAAIHRDCQNCIKPRSRK